MRHRSIFVSSLLTLLALPVSMIACESSSGSSSSSSSSSGGSSSGGADGGATIENECPTPTGAGTTHSGYLSANETWTAEASPHLVPDGLNVSTGVTLTPGSFYCNPKGNVHGPAIAHEETVVIEVYDGPHYPEKPSWYTDERDAH